MRQRVKEIPNMGGMYMFPFLLFSFFNILVVKQQNSIKRDYFDAWSMRTKVSNTFKSMMATKSLKAASGEWDGKGSKEDIQGMHRSGPSNGCVLRAVAQWAV